MVRKMIFDDDDDILDLRQPRCHFSNLVKQKKTYTLADFEDLAYLRLSVGDYDSKGLHAEGEARQAFHELRREQTDRLSLVRAPRRRCVVLIPLVELVR